MPMDPLTDFDWAAHWRRLVDEREREAPVDPDQDFWASVAPRLSYNPEEAVHDPLLRVMEPYLGSRKTAIDVGAGGGRHAVPLADRLDWVTAVEPSEGMRAVIPHRDNLTVVAAAWQDADVAAADLVVCAHVLYFVQDPVPFIEKMEAAARERVFVYMRDRDMIAPSEDMFATLAGRPRTRMPQLTDLWNLLRSRGVDADLDIVTYRIDQVYADLDEALAECRQRLRAVWDEARARAWLEERLEPGPDGSLSYGGEMVGGIAHWQPRK